MSDCCILHASSPQVTHCTFDESQVLEVMEDIDEENGDLRRDSLFEKEIWTNNRNDGDSFPSCDS